MKKVIVYAMGGTIAMSYNESLGGLMPTVTGHELISAVPTLKDICTIDVTEFSNEPSSRISPHKMFELAKHIETTLEDENVAGVVVTHGTDTLEETAYFLDLYIKSRKPVCFTGALRSFSDVSPDGARNILSAVRVAVSEAARNMGTLVVMNDEIFLASEVIKIHSSNVKAFQAPEWGPVGYIDNKGVIFKHKPTSRLNIVPENVDVEVPLVKLYTGMDNAYLDFLYEKGIDGLVLEAFGIGNISDIHVEPVKKFINKNIPVIISSRTLGRTVAVYAYDGGGKNLKSLGVIFSGDITGAKARLKLILALGMTKDMRQIAAYFDK